MPRSSLVFGDVLTGRGGCYRCFAGTEQFVPRKDGSKMAKAARLKILYGEGDAEEQAAPAAAFERAGHTVEKALGRKAVLEALKKSPFDLIVLGPSLTRNDRHHLPYIVKKSQAEAAVLVMHADGSRHPYVDACTDTGASIENVLARIEGMQIAGLMAAAAAGGR
jgi:PleD family two-component response regulator